MISPSIFRQYDIRGRVGTELDNDTAAQITAAFCAHIHDNGRHTLIVGRDNRASSLQFRDIVVKVCLENGIDVVDIGAFL